MTRALARRAQHALAATNERMTRSRWIIWCYESENMSPMIDLLIQRGTLSEADRPKCIHWTAIGRPGSLTDEEVSLCVDADEMLDAAGIPTLSKQGWDAWMQSADALKAFLREQYGELDAQDHKRIEELERTGPRARAAQAREHPQTCISACK